MNLKISILSAITLFSAANAFAQDKIYTRDGDVMEVNVKMVGDKNIIYKKASNDGGPDYTINKKEVSRIEYENGDEDIIVAERRGPMHPGREHHERSERPKMKYGNNILAVSPLQITEQGPGFGLSYERVLDKKRNIVSFYMPLAMAFNVNSPNYDDYYYGYGYSDRRHNYSFYAMPGLKFYPTGGKGIVRYAVGPNLVFRLSEYSDYNYYYNNPLYSSYIYPGYPVKVQSTEFTFGMVINNSLNINPTPHLHMGLEFGIGFSYVSDNNTYYTNYNGYNSYNDPEALIQFGFKIGYRF